MTRALAGTRPSVGEWGLLNDLWTVFLRNPKQQWDDDVWPPPRTAGPTLYVVTDASDDKWSWLEMRDGRVLRNLSDSFAPEDDNPLGLYPTRGTPIYYKELFAILVALRALDARKLSENLVWAP